MSVHSNGSLEDWNLISLGRVKNCVSPPKEVYLEAQLRCICRVVLPGDCFTNSKPPELPGVALAASGLKVLSSTFSLPPSFSSSI